MKRVIFATLSLVGSAAMAATAAEPPRDAAPPVVSAATPPVAGATGVPAGATAASKAAKPRQICHNEQPAGTRFSYKVCRDETTDEAVRRNARDVLETGQRRLQDVKSNGG